MRAPVTDWVRGTLFRLWSGRRPKPGLRILTYHGGDEAIALREHVRVLQDCCTIVGADDVAGMVTGERPWPTDRTEVLITFDDGWLDAHERARDLPQWIGRSPIMFVVGATLCAPTRATGPWLARYWHPMRQLCGPAELRDLLRAGWTLGGHTWSHCDCGQPQDWEQEITASRAALADFAGSEPRFFAYPFGRPQNVSKGAQQAVRDAGYLAAMTTVRGANAPSTPRTALHRDSVHCGWGAAHIRGLLVGPLDHCRRPPVSPEAHPSEPRTAHGHYAS